MNMDNKNILNEDDFEINHFGVGNSDIAIMLIRRKVIKFWNFFTISVQQNIKEEGKAFIANFLIRAEKQIQNMIEKFEREYKAEKINSKMDSKTNVFPAPKDFITVELNPYNRREITLVVDNYLLEELFLTKLVLSSIDPNVLSYESILYYNERILRNLNSKKQQFDLEFKRFKEEKDIFIKEKEIFVDDRQSFVLEEEKLIVQKREVNCKDEAIKKARKKLFKIKRELNEREDQLSNRNYILEQKESYLVEEKLKIKELEQKLDMKKGVNSTHVNNLKEQKINNIVKGRTDYKVFFYAYFKYYLPDQANTLKAKSQKEALIVSIEEFKFPTSDISMWTDELEEFYKRYRGWKHRNQSKLFSWQRIYDMN